MTKRKIGGNIPRPSLECKDCLGPVRPHSPGVFFHAEPKGFPQLQTIARNVGPKEVTK